MRIGFLSIWFQRGATFITKTLMKALESPKNELFVFARTGAVFGVNKMESGAEWDIPNLTKYHSYKVHPTDLIDWINKNKLDIIIFNEEYNFSMVEQVREKTSAKIITYLDFYIDSWEGSMGIYDEVWCSTKRSFNMVKDICNARYIGWGVDTELFKPTKEVISNVKREYIDKKGIFFPKSDKFTFFHNAGWLGNNYRKNTPLVIDGFNRASEQNLDITLFVHAQAGLEKLPQETIKIIETNDRIVYFIGDLPHPGLYYKGKILLFISKLEGLGLPLLEGMSCGLPVIATDEPPMNEFVTDGFNGDLIPVIDHAVRYDNVAFPEAVIDYEKFINKLLNFNDRVEKGKNARDFILEHYSLEGFKKKIQELI